MPVTAVAAVIQHNTSGIVSRKGEGMDRPKGMEGKTYATWEMPIEKAMVKNVVESDGGDFGKVKLVPSTVTDEGFRPEDEIRGFHLDFLCLGRREDGAGRAGNRLFCICGLKPCV